MSMLLRIAVITLGLAAVGVVVGGAVGMVMIACWMAPEGLRAMLNPETLLYGGTFGGVVGGVLGPLSAWLLMRHVPLWLAIGGTGAGTIAGAVLGLVLGGVGASFYAALLGFGASALALRLRTSRRPQAIAAPDAPALRG
jgi:hypothetical protein